MAISLDWLIFGFSAIFISQKGIILGAFWIGRFDVIGKMFQIEEMTECSLGNEMNETDGGECTIDEGTEKPSFREGKGIAISLEKARPAYPSGKLYDEDMGHFS